jgi:spermidine synthase
MLGMAIASFLIEMIQAQMATVLWGGLIAKYTLSMGLFIFALGLGSFYQAKSLPGPKLAWQQLIMAGFAIFSPWLIIWAGTHLLIHFAWSLSALSVLTVGIVAGMEFPLLAKIAENQLSEDSTFIFSQLLSADFVGMGLSSIIFPIYLLRHIGVFKASLLAAALNLIIGFSIYHQHQDEFQSKKSQITYLALVILGALFIFGLWLNIIPITSLAQAWVTK